MKKDIIKVKADSDIGPICCCWFSTSSEKWQLDTINVSGTFIHVSSASIIRSFFDIKFVTNKIAKNISTIFLLIKAGYDANTIRQMGLL